MSQRVAAGRTYLGYAAVSCYEFRASDTVLQACIDIATYYISQMTTEDKNHMDSPTDRICKTMIATILAFPLPMINLPADPRPDDPERIRDRRVFTDEPQMQALITSLDDTSRMALADAAERVRMRLPLLPACFRDWEAQDKMTCI